jgi:hypothetical protein
VAFRKENRAFVNLLSSVHDGSLIQHAIMADRQMVSIIDIVYTERGYAIVR